MKRKAFACEERSELFRKRIAHWWEPNRVVSATNAKRSGPISHVGIRAFFLVPFFEPMCGSASFAVLSVLIYRAKVVRLWPARAVVGCVCQMRTHGVLILHSLGALSRPASSGRARLCVIIICGTAVRALGIMIMLISLRLRVACRLCGV